eukprot:scaffold68463_cov89-Cyclotella_meneghiniana.AAC.3
MIEAQCADRADSGADYLAQVLLWLWLLRLLAGSSLTTDHILSPTSGTTVPFVERYTVVHS